MRIVSSFSPSYDFSSSSSSSFAYPALYMCVSRNCQIFHGETFSFGLCVIFARRDRWFLLEVGEGVCCCRKVSELSFIFCFACDSRYYANNFVFERERHTEQLLKLSLCGIF